MSQVENQSRRRRSPRVSSSSSRSNESLHSVKGSGFDGPKTPSKDGSGRKGNFSKKGVHRTNSQDQVRKLVEKEGRIARNLVTWSVPVNQDEERSKRTKPRFITRKRQQTPEKSGSSERDSSPAHKSGSKSPNRGRSGRKTSQSSTGKKSDLRARYWSYLFDNLKRAVDEIYSTCETDESTVECEEVIMMLDQCRRDFAALIERICVQDAFEKADYKDRPTSLAWEVRKSSPGKSLVTSPCTVQVEPNTQSPVRSLDFTQTTLATIAPKPTVPTQSNVVIQNGPSWADRVKGTPSSVATSYKIVPSSTTAFTKNQNSRSTCLSPEMADSMDEEGWETVRHGKKHNIQNNHNDVKGARIRQDKSSHSKNIINGNQFSRNTDKIPQSCHGDTRTNQIQVKGPSAATNGFHNGTLNGDLLEEINTHLLPPKTHKISLTSEEDDDVPLDDSDAEKEMELEAEHEKAMSDAIEEEETLSKEIEQWQEQALASAIEHEQSLNREIETVEAFVTALNGETETPTSELETETEGEGDANSAGTGDASLDDSGKALTWDEMLANYESKRDSGDSLSWGDTVECAADERPPGRAVAMHQKLSAPSRKRPLAEKIRIHEEKQFKARQQRERLLEERLQKLQSLSEKVKNVRDLQEDLIQSRQEYLADKQKRAENRRKTMLQVKVRKAQEEEAKVNEIAFINTLEAQNKKMEVMSRIQEHAARLQDLQEEKKRKKREEQQAKETAAQERRRQLEADRLARLEEVQQRKLEQEAKYKKEKLEKEKAREEAAREKARTVEMRIAAKKEALQTATEQLQIKIMQKQSDHTRRHEQQLEQVKEKAAGISRHPTQEEVPTVTPYETKKICTLCNVEIVSEVYLYSHLRGKRHQQALLESSTSKSLTEDKDIMSLQYIKEMTKDQAEQQEKANLERRKALKKRAKKLRTRMAAKGREYESTLSNSNINKKDSPKRARLHKIVKDLNRYLQVQGSGPWPSNRVTSLDRSVGELIRIVEEPVDKLTLCNLGGLSALARVLLLVDTTENKSTQTPVIANRVLCHVVQAFTLICSNCHETSQYMVSTNKLATVVDLLAYQLRNFCSGVSPNQTPKKTSDSKETPSRHQDESLIAALFSLLATVIQSLAHSDKDDKSPQSTVLQRNIDLISYIVCSDLIDDIRIYLTSIQEPFGDNTAVVDMVFNCMKLLSSIPFFLGSRNGNIFEVKREDTTQFVITFQQTELVGIISTLYTMILSDGQARHFSPPPPLPEYQIKVAIEGLRALNNMACVDLKALQTSLGSEGVSLEFRHIVSYLLWICGEGAPGDLLHEVILIVGYFTVHNQDNQVFIQSGRNPTLLQQLCGLPFQYFSDPRLRGILFPTLIASCYENEENKVIIEQEVSCALLDNFIQDKMLDSPSDKNQNTKDGCSQDRFCLERRFPKSAWKKACEFLVSNS